MSTAKQELLELLDALPDDVPMETALERLRFKAKIHHSMAQADRGEGVPHEQVMEDLRRWATSLGRPMRSETSER